MLDRRPFWGLIIWLNLCVVIWLVTIQEPVMPETEAASASAALYRLATPTVGGGQLTSANGSSHQQQTQPNQIHDPSRHSTYISLNSSLVSLEKATLTPADVDDASQLIDLHDFGYLMQQPPCDAHIQALILVHTAPSNAEKRSFIRLTWGSRQLLDNAPLRLVFLLGALPSERSDLQQLLAQENAQHRDMVQGNFHDAYRNMTYKHVMALKWFHKHCAQAQLLIKVDDDVYVNTPQLLKYLREANTSTTPMASSAMPDNETAAGNITLRALLQRRSDLLLCREVLAAPVKRSWRSKWRVSFKDYPERYYPPYCPGFAIVYSADVVQRLYQAAQQAPYFWVDDVQITGVLAQHTNTTITTLQPWVLYEGDCKRLLSGQLELEQLEFLVSWHSVTLAQLDALWQLYEAHNDTLIGNAQAARGFS